MSDFFKNPTSSPVGMYQKFWSCYRLECYISLQDSAARKQALMDQIRNELAQANAQQLMNVRKELYSYVSPSLNNHPIQNMNDKCYKVSDARQL